MAGNILQLATVFCLTFLFYIFFTTPQTFCFFMNFSPSTLVYIRLYIWKNIFSFNIFSNKYLLSACSVLAIVQGTDGATRNMNNSLSSWNLNCRRRDRLWIAIYIMHFLSYTILSGASLLCYLQLFGQGH